MKKTLKTLSMVLALMMLVLSFAGCNKYANVPEAFKGKKMAKYIDIIQTGAYTYETTPEDEAPITFAKVGNEKKMLTLRVNNTPISYMFLNGKYYILMPSKKVYTEATEAEVKAYNMDELFNSVDLDQFVNATFVEEGKTSYQAVEYDYEDYYTPLVQVKNRFLFDKDGTLRYLEKLDSEGRVARITPINLYETNETSFEVLSNYQYVEQPTTTTTTKKSKDKTKADDKKADANKDNTQSTTVK